MAYHECTCNRKHEDEWVEIDGWTRPPEGTRRRTEWVQGDPESSRRFVHRDDLPDTTPKENR